MNLKFFISPFFINKYYLLDVTKKTISKYKFTGTVIDVGCGVKPYAQYFEHSSKYVGIDFKAYSSNDAFTAVPPDFFFSKNYTTDFKLPFKKGEFDNVVSFQVLEHHADPAVGMAELDRVVKKGGYIWITIPFLIGIHEQPHDYQRFTKYGLIRLVEKYGKIVELQEIGSIFSVISVTINSYLANIANTGTAPYILTSLLYPPFLLFQYLCLFLDAVFKSEEIHLGYSVVLKK